MRKNNTIRSFTLVVLLMGMLTGVIHLFILRFQAGDIYPAYSSLRSDPLGTRALYESLENFKGIAVQRNYHLPSLLKFEPHTTFFYFGANIAGNDLMPESLSKVFERLTQSGGRLILTFLPVMKKVSKKQCLTDKHSGEDQNDLNSNHDDQAPGRTCENKSETARESDPDKEKKPSFNNGLSQHQLVSIREKWGIGTNFIENLPVKAEKYLALDAVCLRPNFPAAVSWHTNLYFDLLDDSWQTLYAVNGNPVIVERAMGRGSLVLCADSFFVSNEAMRSERHPQLLVWLLGGANKIIFDETHFGIYKQPGVADLLRRYRFQWFFVSLFLLALLFVWKNTVYFIPPCGDDTPAGVNVVSEKDNTRGLIALLRRNFTAKKILPICVHEWEQTFKKDKRIRTGALEHIKNILQTEAHSGKKKTDPVRSYRKISRELKRLGIYSRSKSIY